MIPSRLIHMKKFLGLSATYSQMRRLPNKLLYSTSQQTLNNEDEDKPLKYSATPASKWEAKMARESIQRLWYEPYVIVVSVSIFLIYFCVLREENDVDQELGRSLYSRIEGLEKQQLEVAIDYNRDRGLSTTDLEERLRNVDK